MLANPHRDETIRVILILAISAAYFVLIAVSSDAAAAPFRPANDAQVLEQVPPRDDPEAAMLRGLSQELAADPENLPLAVALARGYISQGRSEADPRYYSYAEAALRPWWNRETPPLEVLVLRAAVRQSRHDFDLALADLGSVLARRPSNAQALLTQSFILQSTGRYGEALESCRGLPRGVGQLVVITCAGRVFSLTGNAEQGYEALRRALSAAPSADPSLRLWALTNLAEIAARLGKADEAEAHFQSALGLGRRDAYLLGAYADSLLDRDRAEEVRKLLQGETRIDALLLRLAIAEARLGHADARGHRDILMARFKASRQRGSQLHRREEARFKYELLGQPGEALRLALENWRVQKEPLDAVVVLEAALAAGDPERAVPAAEWVRGVGLQDVKLDALMRRLDAELG